MSGFAVHLDYAAPLEPDRQTTMTNAIASRGRDRQAVRSAGPCTLMHAAQWATPEAEHEDQPQRHATRDFWLAADARVDNRAELTEALRGSTRQPLRTDADFILAAYERWGAELMEHVIGDFAFVLWDGEREQLVIARDPFGIRPLFVARTRGGWVAASTMPAVLAGLGDEPVVDETYLAGFLHGLPPRGGSIWAGVERLAPGHRRLVDRDRDLTERYWSPSLEPLVQPLGDTIEQTRACFDEAVRCRLRTRDGVASDLSGGLDSSTITVTAAQMVVDVRPVSLAYRIDHDAFEMPYIEAVIEHLGLEGHLIEADELAPLDPVADICAQREPLYSIDVSDTAARFEAVRSLGCSVSLAGVGGDEALYGSTDGHLTHLRQSMRNMALRWVAGHPDGVLAEGLRARRARRARRDRPWLRVPYPQPADRVPPFGRRLGATRLAAYDSPWQSAALELTDRLAAERAVDVRYPFLDRRFVELCLRLPEAQVQADDQKRGLHRRAFGPRLPPLVATRADKADLTGSFVRRMDAAVSPEEVESALAALGDRVDPGPLTPSSGSGTRDEPPPWYRWSAISAGLFLTDAFQGPRELPGDTIA
jgi:asparagine synthase (glutamine-hydrolysing)